MDSQPAKSNEIWSLIKETRKDIQELTTSQKKTDKSIQELTASQKELQIAQKETDRQLKETDKQLKETDKQMKKTDARFNTQWGRLVESLVEGKLVEVLKERGIEVRQTSPRVEVSYKEKDGEIQRKEFDILAINGTEVVVVEVKTALRPSDVSYFLEALRDFKKYCPQYKSHAVYGAVAYLRSDAKSAIYSENKGLFVIRATGDSASIVNKKSFKPKAFS